MFYVAQKTDDGAFTGAIYPALTPEIEAHHAQYHERLVRAEALENVGTDEVPIWQAIGVVDVTPEEVNAERTRRIAAGTDITVAGYAAPIALQGRPEDQMTLMGLKQMAELAIAAGRADPIAFRDRMNTLHDLTPTQLIDLWRQGTIFMQQVYDASWALKELDPIPADFSDDSYWPTAGQATPET